MAYRVLNGVSQYATGTSNNPLTLGLVASAIYQTMAAAGIANGDTTHVRIQHEEIEDEWEVVLVTFTSPSTITRTFDSKSVSPTGDLTDFSAGNKIVSSVIIAGQVVTYDANDDVALRGAMSVTDVAKTAENLGGAYVVANLAALKALVDRPAAVIVLAGRAKGEWTWEAGSSTTADDSLVVQCSSGASGRYKRVHDRGIVNALWFGAEPVPPGGDPSAGADCVPALIAAAEAYGGGKVICPEGAYHIDSSGILEVPVLFEGVGWNERNGDPSIERRGTWFYIDNPSIEPFTIDADTEQPAGLSGFRAIAFEQEHDAPGTSWEPTAYEAVITVAYPAGETVIEDCYWYGIYGAIKTPGSASSQSNGRLRILKNSGQTFSYFVDLTVCLDLTYLDFAHIWPFWSGGQADVLAWQHANGVVIRTRRVDGLAGGAIFAFGYNALLKIEEDTTSTFTGSGLGIHFDWLYADVCKYGIWCTDSGSQAIVDIGSLTTNGFNISGPTTITDSSGIRVDDANSIFLAIGIYRFVGAARHIVEQNGTATAGTVTISSLIAQQYNVANGSYTAFHQATSVSPHIVFIAMPPVFGAVTNPASIVNDSGNFFMIGSQDLRRNDGGTSQLNYENDGGFGFNIRFKHASNPAMFLRGNTGNIEFVDDGYTSVLFSVNQSGDLIAARSLGTAVITVAALPSAATSAGKRAMVSNSNTGLAAGHGNVVAGGGADIVPVYCDGVNWRIG